MDKTNETIKLLNDMLEQEHACAIRYATHAAVLEGPYSETVAARLSEISADEVRHAEILRKRILALDGKPAMKVREQDLKEAESLEGILKINIDEEKQAIRNYKAILEKVPVENAILFQALQELIQDEQEHLEELEALRPEKMRSAV